MAKTRGHLARLTTFVPPLFFLDCRRSSYTRVAAFLFAARAGHWHINLMITRTHTKDDAPSTALYSDCESYRYALTRTWDEGGKRVLFVMLNPSTATEVQNDPTVERCERRARHLGFGAFRVTNIFAWRATDPRDMKAAIDPVGPENDPTLLSGAEWADQIIAAWGTHGAHLGRGSMVAKLLRQKNVPLYHLGLSKHGHPKHPLYLPYTQQPQNWAI